MKKYLLFLALLISVELFAQSTFNLPYNEIRHPQRYKYMRDFLEDDYFGYSMGYSKVSFLNMSSDSEKPYFSPKYGYFIETHLTKILPFIPYIGYSASKFTVNQNLSDTQFTIGNDFVYRSAYSGLDFILLPGNEFIMPYVGVGYSKGTVSEGASIFNPENSVYNIKDLNSSYMRFGIMFNLGENFFLHANYLQSINTTAPFANKQLNLALGGRLADDHIYYNHQHDLRGLRLDYSFGVSYTQMLNRNGNHYDALSGQYLNLRFTRLLPLIFDFGVSRAKYNLEFQPDGYYEFTTNETINMTSFEAGANLTIPNVFFFLPYVGAGIGSYSQSVGGGLTDTLATRVFQVNKIQPYWKAGLALNLGKRFFLNTEIKQSFQKDEQFSFNQFNIGAGFRVDAKDFLSGNAKDEIAEAGFVISYGYHKTDFLNTNFRQHVQNEEIKPVWGDEVNFRLVATYPFMVDVGYFSSRYEISNLDGWNNSDSTKVKHRGIEVAAMMPLLSATKLFVPYYGAGYQFSQLYAAADEPSAEELELNPALSPIEMATSTSSAIYKLGIMFTFTKMAYAVEYKHSFLNKEFPFYQLHISAGFRF